MNPSNEETDTNVVEPIILSGTEPIFPPPMHHDPDQDFTSTATIKKVWSKREDEALIASFFEHCTDAVISTNITGARLWRNIYDSYTAARESRPHELPFRNLLMMKSHWKRMCEDMMKWVGCHEEAIRAKRSGMNDDDVIRTAHIIFQQTNNRNFLFEHACDFFLKFPKYGSRVERFLTKKGSRVEQETSDQNSGGSSKRVRLDEDFDDEVTEDIASGGFVSGGNKRPDGVKKSKAKRRCKGGSSTSVDLMSLGKRIAIHAEMRGEDINLKKEKLEFERSKEMRKARMVELEENIQRLMKLKINTDLLNTLLMKSSLTPREEQLRDKLMSEVYPEED